MDNMLVLKLARLAVKSIEKGNPLGAVRVSIEGEKTEVKYGQIVRELDRMVNEGEETPHCATCEHKDLIKYSDESKNKCQCHYPSYSTIKACTDYCSYHSSITGRKR